MAKSPEVRDRIKIMACSCQHTYQDTKYGHGKRVHNYSPKLGPTGGWRCTVCNKERT